MNLAIVFFTIESVAYGFRKDIIHNPDWLGFAGFQSLRFFTVLSNIFVAIAALIMIIYNVKNILDENKEYPNWLIVLKHTATTAVAVTFITVLLILAPGYAYMGKGYFTLFSNNSFIMHFLTPIMAIITFVFFECSKKVSFKKSLFGLLPVILYSILYTIMVVAIGEANGGWPDFYNFTLGGKIWMIPISIFTMYFLAFALSTMIAKLHNIKDKKSNGK